MVDWSAQATPKLRADSIWSYELDTAAATPTPTPPANHRTRAEAATHLHERLQLLAGRRVLLGFDFAFGYPAGFAQLAGLTGVPWQATWQHLADSITDDHQNRNNRWTVAADLNDRLGTNHLWGVPKARATNTLTATKPRTFTLAQFRHSELHLHSTGRRPFSIWQLLGAGAVGSQSLMGIPVLHRLRHAPDLAERTRIWPFETGLVANPWPAGDSIVIAEVWPGTLEATAIDSVDHCIKDARQIVALAEHFASAGTDALSAAFAPALDPATAALVVAEEGWVLLP